MNLITLKEYFFGSIHDCLPRDRCSVWNNIENFLQRKVGFIDMTKYMNDVQNISLVTRTVLE